MVKAAMDSHVYACVWTHMSSLILGKNPEVELLGNRASVCLALESTAKESSKMAAPFCIVIFDNCLVLELIHHQLCNFSTLLGI